MSRNQEARRGARAESRVFGLVGDSAWTRTRAVLSLGMVFGLGAVGTLAAWSDTASATTGIFSTSAAGVVKMKLAGSTPTHAFAALNKTNLKRGGSIAGMLPVQNTGTENFTYVSNLTVADNGTNTAAAGVTAASLAGQLTVSVYKGGAVTGDNALGTGTCNSTDLVVSKTLAMGTSNLIATARAITVGQSEDLCFKISLPANAPKESRMAGLKVSFGFTATGV